MTTLRFDLGRLSTEGARAVADALRLDTENVRDVALDEARSLSVTVADPAAGESLGARVADMARTQRKIARKVRRATRAAALQVRDIDAELAASADVARLGDGLCALRGPLLRLYRFFEREFQVIAEDFGAEEHHYPVMVPAEVLAEVGYFDHFPQHVTFCSHLRGSLPVLEAVAAEAHASHATHPSQASPEGSGETSRETSRETHADLALDALLEGRLRPPRHVLTPAVCLPCYRLLRGVTLAPGEVRTFTMQNHVFRFEPAGFRPLARAWDYQVRDIVFFGEGPRLQQLREEVMERALALAESLDLEVSLELANDPFFLDASRPKAVYQRLSEVKFELLFPMPHRSEGLAASSFNLHRDFYTGVYGTRGAEGGLVESACMGFGLDRWVYGFLSQKGLDPAGWPERARRGALRA